MTKYDPNKYAIGKTGDDKEHRVRVDPERMPYRNGTTECCSQPAQIQYSAGAHDAWGTNSDPCPDA